MFYTCPITGQVCFNAKNVESFKVVDGQTIPLMVCSNCPSMAEHGDPAESWRTFLHTIFHYLRIDQIIPPEELEAIIPTIKNKNDLNEFLENLAEKKRQLQETPPCPQCGLDLHSLLTEARIGCDQCYTHFHDFIRAMVQRVQDNSTKHEGKRPKSQAQKLDLAKLEREMAAAIKDERYEDAAVIRDQIKSLKSL